jgi:hypothetical protein
MERVYHYLTGTKFRQLVEIVVEKIQRYAGGLDKERKFMGRQWAKRETQILSVIDSTVGMVGDLQAIAGKAMPEISSLDMPLLEDASECGRKGDDREVDCSRTWPLATFINKSGQAKRTTLAVRRYSCFIISKTSVEGYQSRFAKHLLIALTPTNNCPPFLPIDLAR